MQLNLSTKITNEWQVRCIGDVVPALADFSGEKKIEVDIATAKEIMADCEFYMDATALDTTPSERKAYRALRDQILSKLSRSA